MNITTRPALTDTPIAGGLDRYQRVVAIQAALGITITTTAEEFRASPNSVQRSCSLCPRCANSSVRTDKALQGQRCAILGAHQRAASRRLPWDTVVLRIAQHPAQIDVVGGEAGYANVRSNLTVACRAKGHQFSRPMEDFYSGGVKACPQCTGDHAGEVITLAVTHHLLGVSTPIHQVREVTPDYLSHRQTGGLGRLRHDGFFAETLLSLGFIVAVEHQGNQHANPQNLYHHHHPRGAVAAFDRLQKQDQFKRHACAAHGVRLVEVEDLAVTAKSLPEAAALVAQRLAEVVPEIQGLPGYAQRLAQQSDPGALADLIALAGNIWSPWQKLQAQLDAEQSTVRIVDYDPISQRFTLRCERHPEQGTWSATRANAIGSTSGDRQGTRCPTCSVGVRAARRRLDATTLVERANALGVIPLFEPAAYKNNSQRLPWCRLACGHLITASWCNIMRERPCHECAAAARARARRTSEYAAIRAIVSANGDQLISPVDDYIDQQSALSVLCCRTGGCGEIYSMRAQKIKQGQRHGCDRHRRSRKSFLAQRQRSGGNTTPRVPS